MLAVYLPFAILVLLAVHYFILEPLYLSPTSKVPGPRLYALTKWQLALDDWRGVRTRAIHDLHLEYGPVVRIGPKEVHFNSLTALKTIYGAGSGFERTTFYRMFDVYGRQNLFTFHSTKQHGDRKRLLANVYSKSFMLKAPAADMIGRKVEDFMRLLAANGDAPLDTFQSLHYFSMDSITTFLYGSKTGGTSALNGVAKHKALLNDIFDPARRTLSWFAIHHPRLTKWLYTRTHTLEHMLQPFLPMQKPATYTGIRAHALNACQDSRLARDHSSVMAHAEPTVIEELFSNVKTSGLEDLDIASECADHLLAGIDTTADTLMFLFWALSLPENQTYQQKLISEVKAMPHTSHDQSSSLVEASDKLVYLDAIIKEVLRLYAPLPASEPRTLPYDDSEIDGYTMPAGTVVSMSPYSLHRNPAVFDNPLEFKPERWLNGDTTTMNKWFWAFSSGGRMCIGKNLAMAEMTSMVAAVYHQYTTRIAPGFEGKSPAIISRVELFYDETKPAHEEHYCPVVFTRLSST